MFRSNRINNTILPLALAGTALVAALTSTSGFAQVESRIINTEPPRSHASDAVVERNGPRGEVLLEQDAKASEQISEVRVGRRGLVSRDD